MRISSWSSSGLLFLSIACMSPSTASTDLTRADSAAIREVEAAYVEAWLADDTLGVLATLSPDAVLLPPRGLPVAGHATIREYWWPEDGSHTTITGFEWTVEQVGGQSGMAYTRGASTVSWVYVKDTLRQATTARSVNLTLLEQQEDGAWKITHQMWGPSLP